VTSIIPQRSEIVIVGAGFSGLGMAIQLKRNGFNDFLVLERGEDVGGVWRENTYPGCACDIESHLYSFSFYQNPNWSRIYSGQQEIWDYLRECVKHFGLGPQIRFNHDLESARWDETSKTWKLKTSKGDYEAQHLISAVGALNDPFIPTIDGLSDFKGKTFHSSRWDHKYPLEGKKVAVIGTGASAIQFIPQIQPKVEKLTVFQRTPAWVLPRHDRAVTEKEKNKLRRFPLFQKFWRARLFWLHESYGLAFRHPKLSEQTRVVALKNLKKRIKDPNTRAKLIPDYKIGCKRILISDDYYPALAKENVEIVTENVQSIKANGIVTSDGKHRDVDAIIFGTGFRVTEFHFAKLLFGVNGESLYEKWKGSAHAYRGTMTSGFPNLFSLLGPNTGLGHNSVLLMVEAQIEFVLKALRHMKRNHVSSIDVKKEPERRYMEQVDKKSKSTVWLAGCKSWYLDKTGRNSVLWPGSVVAFQRKIPKFEANDFHEVRT